MPSWEYYLNWAARDRPSSPKIFQVGAKPSRCSILKSSKTTRSSILWEQAIVLLAHLQSNILSWTGRTNNIVRATTRKPCSSATVPPSSASPNPEPCPHCPCVQTWTSFWRHTSVHDWNTNPYRLDRLNYWLQSHINRCISFGMAEFEQSFDVEVETWFARFGFGGSKCGFLFS